SARLRRDASICLRLRHSEPNASVYDRNVAERSSVASGTRWEGLPMRTVHTFLHDLLESLPEVGSVYDEHVRDHATCLPHVFFGDVTRFAIAEAMRGFRQDV